MSYKSGYSAGLRNKPFSMLKSKDPETIRGWGAAQKKLMRIAAGIDPRPVNSIGYCDCGNRAVRKKSQIPVCQRCLDIEASYDSAVKTRHDHVFGSKERRGFE